MTAGAHPGGLYTQTGWPLCNSPPFWGQSPLDPTGPRPHYVNMWPANGQWDGCPVRVWLVPLEMPQSYVPRDVLAELTWALDSGRCVALHGPDWAQLEFLSSVVRAWTGGSRA